MIEDLGLAGIHLGYGLNPEVLGSAGVFLAEVSRDVTEHAASPSRLYGW